LSNETVLESLFTIGFYLSFCLVHNKRPTLLESAYVQNFMGARNERWGEDSDRAATLWRLPILVQKNGWGNLAGMSKQNMIINIADAGISV
jgi:hypothetical protein